MSDDPRECNDCEAITHEHDPDTFVPYLCERHAAAPELLAALRRSEAVLSQLQDAMPDGAALQNIMAQGYVGATIVESRAAITKAGVSQPKPRPKLFPCPKCGAADQWYGHYDQPVRQGVKLVLDEAGEPDSVDWLGDEHGVGEPGETQFYECGACQYTMLLDGEPCDFDGMPIEDDDDHEVIVHDDGTVKREEP